MRVRVCWRGGGQLGGRLGVCVAGGGFGRRSPGRAPVQRGPSARTQPLAAARSGARVSPRTLNTLGVTVAAAFLLPRYLLGWAVDDTLQVGGCTRESMTRMTHALAAARWLPHLRLVRALHSHTVRRSPCPCLSPTHPPTQPLTHRPALPLAHPPAGPQIVLPMLAGLFLFDAAYLLALLWKLSFFDRDGGSGGGSSGGDS